MADRIDSRRGASIFDGRPHAAATIVRSTRTCSRVFPVTPTRFVDTHGDVNGPGSLPTG